MTPDLAAAINQWRQDVRNVWEPPRVESRTLPRGGGGAGTGVCPDQPSSPAESARVYQLNRWRETHGDEELAELQAERDHLLVTPPIDGNPDKLVRWRERVARLNTIIERELERSGVRT